MSKQYQRPSEFEAEVRKVLVSLNDNSFLSRTDLQSLAIRDLAGRLCEILLLYCSYRIAPIEGHDINPFDDPFVGAALLDGNGQVLGAHRKEGRNETHAEIETILGALENAKQPQLNELGAKIRQALSEQVW